MNLNRNLFGALAFAAALSAPVGSWATLVGPVETSRAAFDARVTVQGTDTFADVAFGDQFLTPVMRSAGSFSYTAAATNGLYGLTGQLTHIVNTDELVLSGFSSGGPQGVYAFGADFWVDDGSGDSVIGQLTFKYDNVAIHVLDVPAGTSTTGLFVGFVFSSPIDLGVITITSAQTFGTEKYWVMDNMTLAVPEPGTFPLIAFGAAVLLAAVRRRQRGA